MPQLYPLNEGSVAHTNSDLIHPMLTYLETRIVQLNRKYICQESQHTLILMCLTVRGEKGKHEAILPLYPVPNDECTDTLTYEDL